jgi:hypothetical protein
VDVDGRARRARTAKKKRNARESNGESAGVVNVGTTDALCLAGGCAGEEKEGSDQDEDDTVYLLCKWLDDHSQRNLGSSVRYSGYIIVKPGYIKFRQYNKVTNTFRSLYCIIYW